MTPRQFRSTYAWKQARKRLLRSARFCEICGGVLRPDLGPRHALSPTVDHKIALSLLDLTSAAGRALALDSRNLRVAHRGCNSRRGAGTSAPGKRRATQLYGGAVTADRDRWSRHWFGPFDERCPRCRELGGPCEDAAD